LGVLANHAAEALWKRRICYIACNTLVRMKRMMTHEDQPHPLLSHFFTLRLWRVEADNGRAAWRGKLQHVLSGESRYFQDWPALVACLRVLLSEQDCQQTGADDDQRKQDVIQF
jgi:hypothetical protein